MLFHCLNIARKSQVNTFVLLGTVVYNIVVNDRSYIRT